MKQKQSITAHLDYGVHRLQKLVRSQSQSVRHCSRQFNHARAGVVDQVDDSASGLASQQNNELLEVLWSRLVLRLVFAEARPKFAAFLQGQFWVGGDLE